MTTIRLHQPVFAKPKKGLPVRMENGKRLPEEGDTVIHSSYWERRRLDEDVTLTEVKPEKTAK